MWEKAHPADRFVSARWSDPTRAGGYLLAEVPRGQIGFGFDGQRPVRLGLIFASEGFRDMPEVEQSLRKATQRGLSGFLLAEVPRGQIGFGFDGQRPVRLGLIFASERFQDMPEVEQSLRKLRTFVECGAIVTGGLFGLT